MNKREQVNTSYDLEKRLAQSIDRMKESIEKSKALRSQIVKLRQARRQVQAVPQEVRDWFAETAQYLEDEEGEEGEEGQN